MGTPAGTVTMLFTDIEGSTRLLRSLGAEYPPTLAAHFGIITAAVAANGGVQAKVEGDGMLAVFDDATDALRAAVEAQRVLQRHEWPTGAAVRVRMGLHTGEAAVHDGEYLGLGIHQAARVIATAHGGQIVCSSTTAAARRDDAGVAMRDLGAYALRDFDRPEQVLQVVADDLETDFPALRARPAVAHNLPTIRTEFIGRDRELREVAKLLLSHRLVTVAGAGGVGKTRLSFELARNEASSYFDGATVVLLASVTPDRVVTAIADAVGVREEQGQPLRETLAAALTRRHTLLVLDNCEHVVETVADVLDDVLDRTESVAVVATSRRPLELAGEVVYQLNPLEPPHASEPVEVLATNDAVRLFVERAENASAAFALDPANAPLVAQICRHVDGLPLAIELAAARVRSLPLTTLAERLGDTVGLLTTGPRAVDERQRTVSALVDWSYDLLTDDERSLFRRLSVFRGGFDLAAAEAVCSASPLTANGVLDLVDALVQHSLVSVAESGRYRMLVVVRDVAAIHLDEAGEAAATRDRHLDHFASLAAARPTGWWRRIGDEVDNIRAALDWGLAGEGDTDRATDLLLDAWRSLQRRGLVTELTQWSAQTPTPADADRAAALEVVRLTIASPAEVEARVPTLEPQVRATGNATTLAWLNQRRLAAGEALGHPADVLAAVAPDVEETVAHADPAAAARLLQMVSWSSYRTGDLAAAQRFGDQGAAIAATLDDPEPGADFAYLRSVFAATVGDAEAVAEHARAALAVYEETGSVALVQVWNVQAAMHLLAGDLPAAVNAYEETAAASRRAGLRQIEAIAQANLADALTALGRYDDAEIAIAEGRVVADALGLLFVQHLLTSFAAGVAFGRGDLDAMETEWRRSLEYAKQMDTPEVRARTTETTVQLLLARGDNEGAAEAARAGLADFSATEQGDATALLAVALARSGDREAARTHVAAALAAPRPYVVMTARLGVLLAIALGGDEGRRLANASARAAREMHRVFPAPLLQMLDEVLGPRDLAADDGQPLGEVLDDLASPKA